MAPLQLRRSRSLRHGRGAVAATALVATGVLGVRTFIAPLPGTPSSHPTAVTKDVMRPELFAQSGEGVPGQSRADDAPSAAAFFAAAALSAALVFSAVTPQPAFAEEQLFSARNLKERSIKKELRATLDRSQTKPAENSVTAQIAREKELEDAAKKAREQQQRDAKDAEQKRMAEQAMRSMNEQRAKQLEKELADTKKREAMRATAMAQLDKKGQDKNADASVAKAQGTLKAFMAKAEEKDKAAEAKILKEEKAFEKEKQVRDQVLMQLSKRRAEADKAAKEADEIATRIEKLARDAREAAEAAKRLAVLAK